MSQGQLNSFELPFWGVLQVVCLCLCLWLSVFVVWLVWTAKNDMQKWNERYIEVVWLVWTARNYVWKWNERYIEEAGADHQIIIWRQKVAQLALSQISPDVATRSKTGKKIRHKPFINICIILLFIMLLPPKCCHENQQESMQCKILLSQLVPFPPDGSKCTKHAIN